MTLKIEEMFAGLELPPPFIEGRVNVEHYRAKMDFVSRRMLTDMQSEKPSRFNYDAANKWIMEEFRLAGGSERDLIDRRTPELRAADAVLSLLEHGDSAFEQLDADLEAMEAQKALLMQRVRDTITARRGGDIGDPLLRRCDIAELERMEERGKAWSRRIGQILRWRREIRSNGKLMKNMKDEDGCVWEASNPGLFMLYVGRVNNESLGQRMSNGCISLVFRFGQHHAGWFESYWRAINGVKLTPGRIQRGVKSFHTLVIVCHPGSGKSEVVMHLVARHFALHPRTQASYVHAAADEAESALGYIKNCFQANNSSGRRLRALYPGIELDKNDNNKSTMRIRLDSRVKSPTLRASGVRASVLGANNDLQIFDDVCKQQEGEQPTERERVKKILGGTWATRQRGKTFRIIIGTIWHPSDFMADSVDRAMRGTEGVMLDLQGCGGPDSKPPFDPVWPEVYPASRLRTLYQQIRDPAIWAAAYRCNPISEETRIIKKLRYYDPNDDEHTRFIASAQFHVSLDPAATSREDCDRAGIIYAALGEVATIVGDVKTYETRLRILEAKEIHANQVELVDRVAQFALQRPVFQVHAETKTGFHATADIFENKYGLTVNRLEPTNKKKGVRLREVAGFIDDSMPGLRAKVEFPGLRDKNGEIISDPSWQWACSQFLNFGFAEDHVLDATTQLVRWFAHDTGELSAGTGAASATIRRAEDEKKKGDPWMRQVCKDILRGSTPRPGDETAFVNENFARGV